MTMAEFTGGFVGLWVIEKDSGIPILSLDLETQAGKSIDSVLFGGFLVAIRGLMSDFEIGQLNSFQTDQNDLILTSSEKLISVIAIEKGLNVDSWYPTLLKIQQASEKFYIMNQVDGFPIETTLFDNLKPAFIEKIEETIRFIEKTRLKEQDKDEKTDKKKAKDKLKDSGLW
ncbi:MAG: hypothetical protein ACW97X_02275 [Candidatus Hodarchaeales archaeon]|jgi:hypothetical protein